MLLAKVFAAAYILFGAFGLVIISIRENRQAMFHHAGRKRLANLRLLHACAVLLGMVACGIAVWMSPTAAAYLAWAVLGVLVLGRAVSVASGAGVQCVPCLVFGVTLASLATLAIAMGVR